MMRSSWGAGSTRWPALRCSRAQAGRCASSSGRRPLAARGLEYLNTELPTASAFPDGESAFLHRTAEANVAEHGPAWSEMLDSFFPNADLAFGILGTELWSRDG